MAGLKINICFWYLDDTLIEEIIELLEEGNYDPDIIKCLEYRHLERMLKDDDLDLIIADFDLPEALRNSVESLHSRIAFHIPLIYVVGEMNESKAAETLKLGVWDYLLKSHLVKLVPTVYSSQKYGKVLRHSRKVQTDLEETESKYRSIFNTVKDGMMLIDPESFGILDINNSIYELFGFPDEMEKSDVIGQLTNENEGYCHRELREMAKRLEMSDSVSFLCHNTMNKGDGFWSENTLSQFLIGEGLQYVLVIRDIQEQKSMEESLQKSREHFRNLADNSPDVIMRFDRHHRHLYVNKTVETLIGIPIDQFINKSHDEMGTFPQDMVAFWEKTIDRVFSTGEKNTVEFDIDGEDGKISFEWRLFPELDDQGEIQTVLAIARDITDSRRAYEAVNISEERLKLAVEATSLGYWDWKVESDIVFYSPIYMQMLGYKQDELPQELDTWKNLMHVEDRDKTLAFVTDFIRDDKQNDFEIEFRMQCKDGTFKWVCGRGRAVERSENGEVTRLIGSHEDISDRKRNMEIQETLFNISNAVNTTVNLDELYEKIREYLGRIIDTTNCFLALYNEDSKMLTLPFHRDEVDSFTEFPPGKTLTGYVLRTGKAQLVDATIEEELTKQGFIEPVGSPCVSWLGVPLKNDNKIIGVFVVQSYHDDIVYTQEDVSILEFVSDQIALAIERKRDQDNVRESQEKQRRIFESSPDPIIVVDNNGRVIDYNTSLLAALHITNEPVIGQNVFHFIGKKHWRYALRNFKKTWEMGYLKNMEFEVFRADGTHFESEVSTGAIYNNAGEPESMVLIMKDISARKESERTLREAKEKAEESDRLKTAFLSNMSHEIRTPMNAIVGFSDLLNDTEIGAVERSEFIAQINMGADNLMHLIDDIIDIAKIEAGQIKVNKKTCALHELAREQIVMFRQNMERMEKAHIELRLDWRLSTSEVALRTDPFRVKQIITNLLNNAIKFTEEGHVELVIDKKDDFLVCRVRDTGIGIEEDKRKIIFERFMQGHQSKKKLYGGTGLGLAISKNLTELLGGEIGVESEYGKGSEFWFTLPYETDPVNIQPGDDGNAVTGTNWKGKKILVAEDDSSNFNLISEVLKHTNAEILWAKDGRETIEMFNKHWKKLNLVLMDIRMPEMDGYECTRIIKKKNPEIPVIAQTAYAMSGEMEQSREAGCDDYVSKPLHVNKLIETLGFYMK